MIYWRPTLMLFTFLICSQQTYAAAAKTMCDALPGKRAAAIFLVEFSYNIVQAPDVSCGYLFKGLQQLETIFAPLDPSMTPEGFQAYIRNNTNEKVETVDHLGKSAAFRFSEQDNSTSLRVMTSGQKMVLLTAKGFRSPDLKSMLIKAAREVIANLPGETAVQAEVSPPPPQKLLQGWIESGDVPKPGTPRARVANRMGSPLVFVEDVTHKVWIVDNPYVLDKYLALHISVAGGTYDDRIHIDQVVSIVKE